MDELDAFLNAENPEDLKAAANDVVRKSTTIIRRASRTTRVGHKNASQDSVADSDGEWTDDGLEDALMSALESANMAEQAGRSPTGVKPRPQRKAVSLYDKDGNLFEDVGGLNGTFVAVESGSSKRHFVLVPAHIHSSIPRWGWAAIGLGLVMLVAAVVFIPMLSLNRMASRLGDDNEANAQYAMRRLVMRGDERTVKKLYSMASSPSEGMRTRLRAVDAMSLIEQQPEVDRALLRLELAENTTAAVRAAAVAARRQREAARSSAGRSGW